MTEALTPVSGTYVHPGAVVALEFATSWTPKLIILRNLCRVSGRCFGAAVGRSSDEAEQGYLGNRELYCTLCKAGPDKIPRYLRFMVSVGLEY